MQVKVITTPLIDNVYIFSEGQIMTKVIIASDVNVAEIAYFGPAYFAKDPSRRLERTTIGFISHSDVGPMVTIREYESAEHILVTTNMRRKGIVKLGEPAIR